MENYDKFFELSKAERETREAISFADSLEEIEEAMQKHKNAVQELNTYLKSLEG